MWEALESLFQSKNENYKMVLREKLGDTEMIGSDTVTSYLTWILQVQDELAAVGEIVDDLQLVRTMLKGFGKEWTLFIKGIMEQEKLLDWSRLWDDFVQEELQDEELNGGHQKNDDEKLLFSARKRRKSLRRFQV